MGLNFQTCTIINSNLDKDSGKNVKLFEAADDHLFVKRDFHFYKDDAKRGRVISIRKKEGYEPVLTKATIDFDTLLDLLKPTGDHKKNYATLDIFLGVQGADPYIYARPWKDKGIPFWVQFTVTTTDTGTTIAEKVAKVIKKDHLFLIDKELITLTVEGAKLILEGAGEYQRIKTIDLSVYGPVDEYAEKVAEIGDDGITLDERGKNGFGTYTQIVKDLRLPTAMNTQWLHLRKSETPIIDAIYDQYIIDYCAPSVNEGFHAVGQRMESHTQHVFWVRHDDALISEWEEALGTIGEITDYSDNKTVADDSKTSEDAEEDMLG